jgi:hypothetical protein
MVSVGMDDGLVEESSRCFGVYTACGKLAMVIEAVCARRRARYGVCDCGVRRCVALESRATIIDDESRTTIASTFSWIYIRD